MYKFRNHLNHLSNDSYAHQVVGPNTLDCSLGTNPYGFSKKVLHGAQRIDYNLINSYPSVDDRLKSQIIQFWEKAITLKEDQIELACGSMDCITKINKIFIDVGTPVLGYVPQFPDYEADVKSLGGIYESVKMHEDHGRFNTSLFLDHLHQKYALAYIDNPNNPTGQVIPIEDIETIALKSADLGICLVVDEAYGDFMDMSHSAINLLDRFDNLIVLRSFSKGFGLAGLRVGYTVSSPEIMSFYKKVHIPFAVNFLSGCLVEEALKDENFIQSSRKQVEAAKTILIQKIKTLDHLETHAQTPIITLVHGDPTVDLYAALLKQQVISVPGSSFVGLGSHCVRVRIPSDVNLLIDKINRLP